MRDLRHAAVMMIGTALLCAGLAMPTLALANERGLAAAANSTPATEGASALPAGSQGGESGGADKKDQPADVPENPAGKPETPAAPGEPAQPEEPTAPGEPAQPEQATPQDEPSDREDAGTTDGAPVQVQAQVQAATTSAYQDMYRLYNPNSGEHFYTASTNERDGLTVLGWRYEGVGWQAPVKGDAVYRLYNPNAGDHHYTLSAKERDGLVVLGWRDEGIGWYSDSSHRIPVYRQYNPNAVAGAHNFTQSKSENDQLVRVGWSAEGIAWYAYDMLQYAPSLAATVASKDGKVTQTVASKKVGDSVYVFLPAHADTSGVRLSAYDYQGAPTSLTLRGNGASATVTRGTTVNLARFGALDASGRITATAATAAGSYPVVVMKSANIDAVYVTSAKASQDRAWVEASPDHTRKAKVGIAVVDAAGTTVYAEKDGKKSTIKGRGNSTWGIGDKKPYQISLDKKTDLLQTGEVDEKGKATNAAKKWILLANANDPTLIHTSIGYDTGLELGMPAGCQGAPVDLYYDGEYRGSYYLCEKVEVGDGRVDIHELEKDIEKANVDDKGEEIDLATYPTAQATNKYGNAYQYVKGVQDPVDKDGETDITGGYLLELDNAYYKTETCWFVTTSHDGATNYFVVKSPEYASAACMEYISEYVQAAIDNAYANKFYDGTALDVPACDLTSLAQTYLVSEFYKNIDGLFTSTYFYKDRDPEDVDGTEGESGTGAVVSPLVAAPLWDFDACMGTRVDWHNNDFRKYEGFTSPQGWWVRSNATVKERVRELYHAGTADAASLDSLVEDVLLGGKSAVGAKGHLHSIAYYRDRVARSQAMNQVLYGITAFNNVFAPYDTWAKNVDYLKDWIYYRNRWWEANYQELVGSDLPVNPTSEYGGVDYSDVYDYHYYLAHNADVKQAYGGDPAKTIEHFVTCGMAEGRQASENFNVQTYKNKASNEDLRRAFGNNLALYYKHYVEYGFKEGRLIW